MGSAAIAELSAEQRQEVAAWIEANSPALPPAVRTFLALHQPYLSTNGNLRKAFEAAQRDLRRALHLTPSSEKRRPSGSPLACLPGAVLEAKSQEEQLVLRIARGNQLAEWHRGLRGRHEDRVVRLKERLAKMSTEKTEDGAKRPVAEPERLEDIELTEEQVAANAAAAQAFAEHLGQGGKPDPALMSVNETLMPAGAVLETTEHDSVPAEIPAHLANARVVKTLNEPRVRYDLSVAITRIEIDVEKKVLVDQTGERHVVSGSTAQIGPSRYAVTWEALATLAILVGQFAMPFHRLSTLFFTATKRFTAGALSRMLHYVAERLVPIYLALADQLANGEILAGDDTSCRVVEVTSHMARSAQGQTPEKPPWADYATMSKAEESFRRCEAARRARLARREAGDRTAKRTPEESPSLGILIGRQLGFEWPRRNGDGPKEALHTTVVSGRSARDDPRSLIVFYRSHLGSCGDLFEQLLRRRDRSRREVILQGDLSTTNLVTAPDLRERFAVRAIGCSAHARRPFAQNEDDDPVHCSYMLHLFLGLAIYEERLDAVGRNRQNVLAVRQNDSRDIWNDILKLAHTMADHWSKATTLGTAARYIIKHFAALTAHLDDPRLEPSNNQRERMLRMEKLIEGSAMFRRSLEGRFVLDVVRTLLQTAVAAGVPVHEYLVSVLRADPAEISKSPGRFTPRAWAAREESETAPRSEAPP